MSDLWKKKMFKKIKNKIVNIGSIIFIIYFSLFFTRFLIQTQPKIQLESHKTMKKLETKITKVERRSYFFVIVHGVRPLQVLIGRSKLRMRGMSKGSQRYFGLFFGLFLKKKYDKITMMGSIWFFMCDLRIKNCM